MLNTDNSLTYANHQLFSALEYLHVAQGYTFSQIIDTVVAQMEVIATTKASTSANIITVQPR